MPEPFFPVIGRIGPNHRIYISPTPKGFEATLKTRGEKTIEDLGVYSTLKLAKQESATKAIQVLTRTGEPHFNDVAWFQLPPRIAAPSKTPFLRTLLQRVLPLVAGIAGVLAAILVSFPTAFTNSARSDVNLKIQTLQNQVQNEGYQLEILTRQFRDTKTAVPETALPQLMASFKTDLDGFKQRLANYEATIGDDAPKRLAIPILRKDMDILRDEHKNDLTAIHEEIARTFDLMKWLLGLVGFSTLLGAASSWFTKPRGKEAA